jgi:hypothetical protein
VARALASMRLVAAAAIDQSISQKRAGEDDAVPEGRLLVQHGLVRKTGVTVSSAATTDDIARARSKKGAGFSTTRVQQLEGLQAGLSELTSALYRQEPKRDASALDEAVRHAIAVAKDVSSERGRFSRRRRGFGEQGTLWRR